MKKADEIHRIIAKAIDFLIAGALSGFLLKAGGSSLLSQIVGTVIGPFYLLVADGFFHGRSIGKRMVGLSVLARSSGNTSPAAFRQSLLRNLTLATVLLLGCIPFINVILFPIAFLGVVGAEIYFIHADDEGLRIGDIFAGTLVVEDDAPTHT